MKHLTIAVAFVALVFGVGWVAVSQAQASEYAEYWDASGYYWDSGRITAYAPATSFSTSLTSKACIKLKSTSQVSAGWKMADLMATPKAYFSRPEIQGFTWLEVDHYLFNHSWNTSKVYELVHDPSWSTSNTWEIWVDHTRRATVNAYRADGTLCPWGADEFHSGGRTSNNTLKHWSRISMFELRTGGSGGYWWPVYGGALNTSPGGWLNMNTDNATYNFRVISDNW